MENQKNTVGGRVTTEIVRGRNSRSPTGQAKQCGWETGKKGLKKKTELQRKNGGGSPSTPGEEQTKRLEKIKGKGLKTFLSKNNTEVSRGGV